MLAAATIVLGLTGRLGLYIHPRTLLFAMGMAVLAAVALVVSAGDSAPQEAAPEADPAASTASPRTLRRAGAAIAVLALGVTLFILPPRSLSAAMASARQPGDATTNTGTTSGSNNRDLKRDIAATQSGSATVKEWADLIRRGARPRDLAAAHPTLTGMVIPDPSNPDRFMLSRLLVTCCAADARPVGISVEQPGWRSSYPEGSWVEVSGKFTRPASGNGEQAAATSQGSSGGARVVFTPERITPTTEPEQPYVY